MLALRSFEEGLSARVSKWHGRNKKVEKMVEGVTQNLRASDGLCFDVVYHSTAAKELCVV